MPWGEGPAGDSSCKDRGTWTSSRILLGMSVWAENLDTPLLDSAHFVASAQAGRGQAAVIGR